MLKSVKRKDFTFFIFFVLLISWTNVLSGQNKNSNYPNHYTFIEYGGITWKGAAINYEFSFPVLKSIRINPGLGYGYAYTIHDFGFSTYYTFFPSVKVLIGKKQHFLEIGSYINMHEGWYNIFTNGTIGYRYLSNSSPFFLRVSINSIRDVDALFPWAGLSAGLKF